MDSERAGENGIKKIKKLKLKLTCSVFVLFVVKADADENFLCDMSVLS